MKKKTMMLGSALLGSALALGLLTGATNIKDWFGSHLVADGDYSLSFTSSSNVPSSSGGSTYAQTVNGNSIEFSYDGFLASSLSWGTLEIGGFFANATALSGLKSIAVVGEGAGLTLKYGWSASFYDVAEDHEASFTSNLGGKRPSFLRIENEGSSPATIHSITLTYTCLATEHPPESGLSFTEKADGSYEVSDYFASYANVVIPSTHYGRSVTSIGEYAFQHCTSLSSITIPDSVTSIGEYAFSFCSSLSSIAIPSSVASIGGYAFWSCASLSSIEVDPSNPVYDSRNDCNAIVETATNTLVVGCKDTAIPSSVTSIGSSAFKGCTSLSSISIPSSVTSIGDTAFEGCTSLSSISIPSSVTSMGIEVFGDCSSLQSVTIPSSVTSIGDCTFFNCSSLSSIFIPSSVTSIGGNVFFNCSSLSSVAVDPSNPVYDSRNDCNAIVETATNTMILGCKNTVIPSSVTSIGWGAFYGCTSLTSVSISSSITSVVAAAFAGCTSLSSIEVDPSNPVYDSRGGCNAIIETATNTLVAGCKATIVPDSVTSIGDSAFEGCSSLSSVTIHSSIDSIGEFAFAGCSSLSSVSIPSSMLSIGNGAFEDCSSLSSIFIPSSVDNVGYCAFYGCSSLTDIYCGAYSKPPFWSSAWKSGCSATVHWGYTA